MAYYGAAGLVVLVTVVLVVGAKGTPTHISLVMAFPRASVFPLSAEQVKVFLTQHAPRF